MNKGKYNIWKMCPLWKPLYLYLYFSLTINLKIWTLIPPLPPPFPSLLSVACLGLRNNEPRHILICSLLPLLLVRRFRRFFYRGLRSWWLWGGSDTYLSKAKCKTLNCMQIPDMGLKKISFTNWSFINWLTNICLCYGNLYNKSNYSRILIGHYLWSIRGETQT